jgi:hypothetical protein
MAPIDGQDPMKMKAWSEFWLRYDAWGEGDMTVTWYGDNHYPSTAAISMNAPDAPTMFYGHRLGEVRGMPTPNRAMDVVHLNEGGMSIQIQIEGTRGRTRLRSFTLNMGEGARDVTANRWFNYDRTARPVYT